MVLPPPRRVQLVPACMHGCGQPRIFIESDSGFSQKPSGARPPPSPRRCAPRGVSRLLPPHRRCGGLRQACFWGLFWGAVSDLSPIRRGCRHPVAHQEEREAGAPPTKVPRALARMGRGHPNPKTRSGFGICRGSVERHQAAKPHPLRTKRRRGVLKVPRAEGAARAATYAGIGHCLKFHFFIGRKLIPDFGRLRPLASTPRPQPPAVAHKEERRVAAPPRRRCSASQCPCIIPRDSILPDSHGL